MCLVKKYCLSVTEEKKCIFIAFESFVVSSVLVICSVFFLTININHHSFQSLQNVTSRVLDCLHFGEAVNHKSKALIFGFTILIALIWFASSVMLVIGVIKKKPGLVLFYFLYSSFMLFVTVISGLLLLLQRSWIVSSAILITALIKFQFLVTIHKFYEMQRIAKEDQEELLIITDTE